MKGNNPNFIILERILETIFALLWLLTCIVILLTGVRVITLAYWLSTFI